MIEPATTRPTVADLTAATAAAASGLSVGRRLGGSHSVGRVLQIITSIEYQLRFHVSISPNDEWTMNEVISRA